ncbi:MAG: hypothetical protein AAGJ85_08765, partial [Pseudomonadota bacterium]
AFAEDAAPPVTSDSLVGTWDVSLYFSADAPPSSTVFIVSSTADGEVVGSFYGSEISESGVTVFQDEVLFTAVTSDGSGPYLHSGRLDAEAGMIEGQTLSTGRDFLMAWTAVRQAEVEE